MTDLRPMLGAIDLLYNGLLTPTLWPAAVQAVTDVLGAGHGIVFALGSGDGGVHFAANGMDAAHAARICSPEAAQLGSRMLRGMPMGLAMSSASVIPDRDMEMSPFYNEVIRPPNGFYSVSACLKGGGQAPTMLNFCRPRKGGPFGINEVGMLQALLPHIANVFELSRRLAATRERNHDLSQLLDHVDSAVIVADAAGQPCFANGRALRIIAQADGLLLGASGLVGSTPAATHRLRQAMASIRTRNVAASSAGAGDRYSLRLERPSRRPPLLLSLFPIWPLGAAIAGAPAPRIAIFVTEPDDGPPIDRDAIAEAFHLTPREAAVAALLASGHDLRSAATVLAISVGTARYHLKNAFDKTNTRNQATLVAALRGFVRPGSP